MKIRKFVNYIRKLKNLLLNKCFMKYIYFFLKHKFLLFILIIFLLISLRFSNEIRNGWLGPNASVKIEIPTYIVDIFKNNLSSEDIILFDDNTYHVLKFFPNKKIPITYFKLYLDAIPLISKNNLQGYRGVALVNCAFINEFNQFNKFLTVNTVFIFEIQKVNFCFSYISES